MGSNPAAGSSGRVPVRKVNMNLRAANVTIFFAALGLCASCAAQSTQHFWQDAAGAWHKGSRGANADETSVEAEVSCGAGDAKIEITWYSESADWTAVDHYSAGREPYFERQLTFAQFPIRVIVEKRVPTAATSVRFEGPQAMVDEFKSTVDLPPVVTFDRPEQFPFTLPSCARTAFSERLGGQA